MIIEWASIATAVSVLGTTLYYVGDYTGLRPVFKKEFVRVMDQSEQNTLSVNYLQWQLLDSKAERGALTFGELQEYCTLTKILDYKRVIACLDTPPTAPPLRPPLPPPQ